MKSKNGDRQDKGKLQEKRPIAEIKESPPKETLEAEQELLP